MENAPGPESTDAALLGRFVHERSEDALRLLIERHGEAVRRTCLRLLRGNAVLADDAAQAVFIVLARKAGSIRNRDALPAWLFRTAHLVAQQVRRAEARHGRRGEASMDGLAAPQASLSEEDREELYAAIAGLKVHEQDAVVLHYLRGYSREDAARALGCSLDALHKRLGVALERLQATLSRRGVVLSTTALGTALAQEASIGMSGAWAAAWTTSALNGAPAAKAGALAQGALKTMFWMQLKPVALLAGSALLLASAAFFVRGGEVQPVQVILPGPKAVPSAPVQAPKSEQPLEAVRVLGFADFQAPSVVRKVAFSPDSKLLATACDKEIVIWDLDNRTIVQRIPLGQWTWDMQFVAGGERLLIAAEDQSFHIQGDGTFMVLWDLKKKELVRAYKVAGRYLNPCRMLLVSPDERYGFIAINGDKSEQLLVWDLDTGKLEKNLSGVSRKWTANQYNVKGMCISKDGRLASVDTWGGYHETKGEGINDGARSHFMIWDWAAEKCEHEWELSSAYRAGWPSSLHWVNNETQVLLDGCYKNGKTRTALLLDAETGKVVREIPGAAALSNDGKTLVQYDEGTVKVCDFASGIEREAFKISTIEYAGESKISPDGRWLACDFNRETFMLVDLKQHCQLAPGGGHQKRPYWMRYTPDGRLMTQDGAQVRVFDDVTGRVLMNLNAKIYYVAANTAYTSDSRIMLGSGSEDGRAEIWDVARGTLLGHLSAHRGGGVKYLTISADGNLGLTVGEYDGTCKIHDLKTGAMLYEWKGPTHSFFGPQFEFGGVAFSAKMDHMYVADHSFDFFNTQERQKIPSPAGFNGAFEARTGKRLFWFKDKDGQPIESAIALFLAEGDDTVALVVNSPNPTIPQQVVLCKASDGTFIRECPSPGLNMSLTPDGKRLVGPNASMDIDFGKMTQTFAAGKKRVVSPSGLLLAVLDDSSCVRIVDTATGVEILRRDVARKELGTVVVDDVVWNAAETQVALYLKEKTAILQVDLFETRPLAAEKPAGDPQLKTWADDLGSQDPLERERAGSGLANAGEAAHPRLMEIVNAAKPPVQETVLAIGVLESQARRGLAAARTRLDTLAKLGLQDLRGQTAISSLWRLDRAEKTRELRRKNDAAAPLTWPVNPTVEHKDDF